MGMELAQFRFQSELDFVQAATTPDDSRFIYNIFIIFGNLLNVFFS